MRLFFNNNILTQSIICLPVFSKYALNRERNIFLVKKKQAMIPIFAYVFDCRDIFSKITSKSNTNVDKDKKQNFGMELVKKRLDLRSDSTRRVEVYLPLIFCTCAVETVKSCISLFLLLANL